MTETPAVATGETSTEPIYLIAAPSAGYFAPLASMWSVDCPPGWSLDARDATHYATHEEAEQVVERLAKQPREPQGARPVPDPLPRSERYGLAAEKLGRWSGASR